MDCSLPHSSIHGIFQARILEWVAISFSRGSSRPRDRTWVFLIAGRCFTIWDTREALLYATCLQLRERVKENVAKCLTVSQLRCRFYGSGSEVAQSCPTFCDHMDCSLPGSAIYGIFQARVLEWVAISFSRGSSQPRDWTQVSCIVGRRFTIWATREAYRLYGCLLTILANSV